MKSLQWSHHVGCAVRENRLKSRGNWSEIACLVEAGGLKAVPAKTRGDVRLAGERPRLLKHIRYPMTWTQAKR
jgi:hypothetical protein